MKKIVLIFFAALVVTSAQEQECREDRAQQCVNGLLEFATAARDEEAACEAMKNSLTCMRKTVDDCLLEGNQDVENLLQQLENMVQQNCEDNAREISEEEKCVDVKGQKCLETIAEIYSGKVDEEEVCSKLTSSLSCIRQTIDECMEEVDQDSEALLQQMESMLNTFCPSEAVSTAEEDDEECGEERANECVEGLLTALLSGQDEEDVCEELKSSTNCLRDAVEKCTALDNEEVKTGLDHLEKIMEENCPTEDQDDPDQEEEEGQEDEEMSDEEKCVQEHEEYISECTHEGARKEMSLIVNAGEVSEEARKCLSYQLISDCAVKRIGEKCGEKAEETAKEELEDMPDDIKKACKDAGPLELTSLKLLEDKTKK